MKIQWKLGAGRYFLENPKLRFGVKLLLVTVCCVLAVDSMIKAACYHINRISVFTQAEDFIARTSDAYKSLPHIPITYRHSPKALCSGSNVYMVMLVKTHPRNFEKRQVIRNTWGSEGHRKTYHGLTKVAFLLGLTTDSNIQSHVDTESQTFADLIQGEFVDSYMNLTYKLISGINWTVLNCPAAQYYASVDDDALLSVPRLANYTAKHLQTHGRFIACFVETNSVILRSQWNLCNPCSKWCVAKSEFQYRTFYPLFCHGLIYLMPLTILNELSRHTEMVPYYRFDDVYLTGLVATKIKPFRFSDIRANMAFKWYELLWLKWFGRDRDTLLTVLTRNREEFYDFWYRYFA